MDKTVFDNLLLRKKPMAEMTDEELRAGIAELQNTREALVAEHRKKHQEALAAGVASSDKKPRAPKAPKEKDEFSKNLFASLKAAADKAKQK